MKNKEKYMKEIVDAYLDGETIAVKADGKPCICQKTSCKECIFYDRNNPYVRLCRDKIHAWANSEYIERPVISKRDKAFLEYLREEHKFIARDENGELFIYESRPRKINACWHSCWNTVSLTYERYLHLNQHFNVDFPMIKWSDEEPWLIEDLKKLEVVDEYELIN